MKRLIILLSCLTILIASPALGKNWTRGAVSGITGGVSGYLDSFDGLSLQNGDSAFYMSSNGLYVWYLDSTCNLTEAAPFVVSPDSNAGTKRWILIQDPAKYYVNYGATDQGDDADDYSLKDVLSTIGTSKEATVVFKHWPENGNTTTYTVSTTYDASAYTNVTFVPEPGARLAPATTKTLTLPSPSHVVAAPTQQIFSGAGTVAFGVAGIAEAGWAGSDGTAIETMMTAVGSGGGVRVQPGTYEDVDIDGVDNRTLILSEGVVFKTSDSGLTPALLIQNCDDFEIQGRIVADGNATNNAHAYGGAEIGYAYSTVGFKACARLLVGSVKCENSWHQGIVLEEVTYSQFESLFAKDSYWRGVVVYAGTQFSDIRSINSDTSGAAGCRIGGAVGSLVSNLTIGSIKANDATTASVLVEQYTQYVDIAQMQSLDSGQNGIKLEDTLDMNIGSVLVRNAQYHGFMLNSSNENSRNINVNQVRVISSGLSTGDEYAGVHIRASGTSTTSDINISEIIVTGHGNATYPGYGVLVRPAAAGTIENLSFGSIISKDNNGTGVRFVAENIIRRINVDNIIAIDNAVLAGVDLTIDVGVYYVNVSKMLIGSRSAMPTNSDAVSLNVTNYGGGSERIVTSNELTLTSSATWTEALPANSYVEMFTCRVTDDITINGGGTHWRVGDAANVDRFSVESNSLASGTSRTINNSDGADVGPFYINAATNIVVSPNAGAFTAGKVRITVIYTNQYSANE